MPRAAVDAFLRGHCWPLCDLTALTNLRLRGCGLDAGARRARARPARTPGLSHSARPAAAAHSAAHALPLAHRACGPGRARGRAERARAPPLARRRARGAERRARARGRAECLRLLSLAYGVLHHLRRLDLGENPAIAPQGAPAPTHNLLAALLSCGRLELLALERCGARGRPWPASRPGRWFTGWRPSVW